MALKAKRSPVGVKSSQYSQFLCVGAQSSVCDVLESDPVRSFVVADGSRFGSIWELGTNLRIMNPDIYGHHVSEEKMILRLGLAMCTMTRCSWSVF